MLLQVQLTLLQKIFEGGALAPLAPPLDPPLSGANLCSYVLSYTTRFFVHEICLLFAHAMFIPAFSV